ncbi:GAF domain-containing protein [Sandaracinobacter sp. RS1-74]|uniref:GAF domain-containing protein n=1 Tax=Sandaracinobacteroides sayramensis TaxID=2913411 RepID=UPI001ED9F1CD|nr:GAF domain-containing protein [Sandaracinobacteroides sayramensis]MCG2841533.1 GAF domain-containing protein [Sandaracinobacteroides sayramensis]
MYEAVRIAHAPGGADFYRELGQQMGGLLAGERNWMANFANCAALLFEQMPDLNWAGFYLLEEGSGDLVVGPFQGKPACARIARGRGVCGTALAEERAVLVPDVHEFPGHIACDAASRSELVIPLRREGRVFGVLDLDSPLVGRFSDGDLAGLERLMVRLVSASDW